MTVLATTDGTERSLSVLEHEGALSRALETALSVVEFSPVPVIVIRTDAR